MCGIAGILRVHPPGAPPPPPEVAIPESWLDILDESIKHRGPDGQGRFRDRAVRADGTVVDVALVHRRLAIIDLKDGHQPMVSPRGRNEGEGLVAVVFNGCIYNHRELRKELQAAGHRFETDHSDTEVLVHGWREWHEHLPEHLDAMCAAAIWDGQGTRLMMFRDRAGEKPLYESLTPDGRLLVFGSTVPAVLNTMGSAGFEEVCAVPETWALQEWIRFGYGSRPPTAWVHEVGPGERRTFGHPSPTFDRETVVIETGEPIPERQGGPTMDAQSVHRLLRDAVASRLDTDVPLGCFLSGGVDSSLIAHYAMANLGRLRTFTVCMPDPRHDESAVAERVAAILKTDHHTLPCEANPAQDLVGLIHQLGLPFGDSSLLPTHWVSRAARGFVAVSLSGDGADELFGGYERYRANAMLTRARVPLSLVPLTSGAPDERTVLAKAGRLADAARREGYRDLLSIFPSPLLERLVPDWRGGHRVGADSDPLQSDFSSYLPEDLLRKTDTASMAVALELRAPFLAPELCRSALVEPLSSLMPRGQRKGLLRQVARKYLPAEIVDRPKQGFAIPIGEWFRTDYGGMKQLLMDHLNSAEPWGPASLGIDLNMKFVRQMLDEHMGTGPSGRIVRDHSQRLYMLLVLSIWAKWIGSL